MANGPLLADLHRCSIFINKISHVLFNPIDVFITCGINLLFLDLPPPTKKLPVQKSK